MKLKYETTASKRNTARLKRLFKERPAITLKEATEVMAKEGYTMKRGKPVNLACIEWIVKKMRQPQVRQSPQPVAKPSQAGLDHMELITLCMAARIPDATKLKIIQVLANAP